MSLDQRPPGWIADQFRGARRQGWHKDSRKPCRWQNRQDRCVFEFGLPEAADPWLPPAVRLDLSQDRTNSRCLVPGGTQQVEICSSPVASETEVIIERTAHGIVHAAVE